MMAGRNTCTFGSRCLRRNWPDGRVAKLQDTPINSRRVNDDFINRHLTINDSRSVRTVKNTCCPAAAPASAIPLNDAEAARLAKALAHPVRLQILRILMHRNGCYCGDLCAEFTLAQSTVSQHLRILREAGLIRGNPEGTAVCYCAEPERLNAYREWVLDMTSVPAGQP